ncbi:hypothetical protein G6M02_07985 [Agrobacterium rhizogenes]|nr:hypothetical protein [Rhizobium rhizogenes]
MSEFLLGLQYCAGAFGICVLAGVGGFIVYLLYRLIYGQSRDSQSDDESGAYEGDIRSFRLRDAEGDLNEEGR